MPATLQNLLSNVGSRMNPNQPNGSQPNPTGSLPASLQAGNTPYNFMEKLSGLFGGGNPLQQQNNGYVKGAVDQYMKQRQAAQAAAQAAAQKAGAAAMKRLTKMNPTPVTPLGVNPGPTQAVIPSVPQGQ